MFPRLKIFKVAPIAATADTDVTEISRELHAGGHGRGQDEGGRGCLPAGRESSAALARSAGRTLGELSYASVDTFENVRPMPIARTMMKMNVAAAPAPTEEFTPQTISVTAHVNALFGLK
jgi:hypothetical protein